MLKLKVCTCSCLTDARAVDATARSRSDCSIKRRNDWLAKVYPISTSVSVGLCTSVKARTFFAGQPANGTGAYLRYEQGRDF